MFPMFINNIPLLGHHLDHNTSFERKPNFVVTYQVLIEQQLVHYNGLLNSIFDMNMSRLVEKPTLWFPNRSDTNRPVKAQKRARSLKFRILEEEEV